MRFFTKPRVLYAHQLRVGDQIAFHKSRKLDAIRTEASYIDADLAGHVVWIAVNAQPLATDERGVEWDVRHSHGENTWPASRHLIVREAIELDPWSYVRQHGEGK